MDTALSHARPAADKRRALSLIEAAIVLGVVGLVIGGIWAAAASVNKKMKYQATVSQIYKIIENVRTSYTNMPDYPGNITNLLIQNGTISGDFVKNGQAANPWGGTITVSGPFTVPRQFTIGLDNLPQDICISFLMLFPTEDQISHAWNWNPVQFLSPPITLSLATAACAATTTNYVEWRLYTK